MKVRILCSTAVLLLALFAGAAIASNPDRIGTAGATELLIPNSARGLALGAGLTADPGGIEDLYYNPAAIAGITNVEAYFSNYAYIANMKKNYFGVGVKTSLGTLAASVDVLSIGDIIETTELNPEGTGRVFSPNFSILGLSYGRYMTDQVTVGATAKLVSESILQTRATGVAFDAGIQYRPGPKGLWFGLALKNFGPNMKFSGSDFESFHRTSDNTGASDRSLASLSSAFELPSYFEMGARYEYATGSSTSIAGYGAFRSNNFYNDEWKLGGEISLKETLFVRGGGTLTDSSDAVFGPAFGVGFAIPIGGQSKIFADYTVQTVQNYFDDSQMFSVKFAF